MSDESPVVLNLFDKHVVVTFESAQHALFVMLGAALVEAQVAECQADLVIELLTGAQRPFGGTHGQKAKRFLHLLPADLAASYSEMVAQRNYLVHELVSDFGGWTGHPELDGPEIYENLLGAIRRARETFASTTGAVNHHLVAAGMPLMVVRTTDDGIQHYDSDTDTYVPLQQPEGTD